MPKTKRYTPKTHSTPTQIQANTSAMSQSVSHGSQHSEPIAHTSPSINIEVQNDQTAPYEDQNPQPTEQGDQNPQQAYRRKSAKYCTVHLIDEEGVIKEDRLRVAYVLGLTRDKKVILEWNQEDQPIGEAAGLLGGFLGSFNANVNKFPISYEKWLDVPQTYKDHVWDNTIKEIQTGRSCSRSEMYSVAQRRKDGTFVNDEAKQKSVIFGKEHPGHVRGIGFGVCPSQVIGPAYRFGNSTMSSSSGDSSSELTKLKTELEASNARVEALEQEVEKVRTLEQEVAKVRSLEDHISFLMENYRGQLPARFNQVTDLGSPMEARPSSSAGHNPQNHGPSSTV
ncbi:hypothetical protein SESBI_31683 [Sesbania bispinosa]|nr:hypothetical protein SESBI_31683 [Sesbania bispinosa]